MKKHLVSILLVLRTVCAIAYVHAKRNVAFTGHSVTKPWGICPNRDLIHKSRLILILSAGMLLSLFNNKTMAQQQHQMVRLAKIQVDPSQLEQYNMALKEQMTTAIRVEPGVLTYYAVADKTNPSHITILEIYADTAAYQLHIQTPHFKKYKETAQHMVKGLELVDVNLIASARKTDM